MVMRASERPARHGQPDQRGAPPALRGTGAFAGRKFARLSVVEAVNRGDLAAQDSRLALEMGRQGIGPAVGDGGLGPGTLFAWDLCLRR